MSLIQRVIDSFGAEDHEQYVVIQFCDARDIDVFHVPNSTWTKSIMVRTRNTLLGVRAGIPDLWFPIPGVGMVVIEMKRPKRKGASNNYPTPAQRVWIEKLNAVPGVEAFTAYGADEAIEILKRFHPKARDAKAKNYHICKVPDDDTLF